MKATRSLLQFTVFFFWFIKFFCGRCFVSRQKNNNDADNSGVDKFYCRGIRWILLRLKFALESCSKLDCSAGIRFLLVGATIKHLSLLLIY